MSGGDDRGGSNQDWRFNQTLRNVQGMLKGQSFPGKVLLSRRSEPSDEGASPVQQHLSDNSLNEYSVSENSYKGDGHNNRSTSISTSSKISSLNLITSGASSSDRQNLVSGDRATDSTRITKFSTELSRPAVILEKLRELAWNGVPPYMRPSVWRLLLGYAPPSAERRSVVLKRKRQEYVDCVSQYYDIPDSERTDEEINMLRQISVDCPRTVPEVSFFQHEEIQKSLERILYTWAIRHPASGYVQGINDIVTPFLLVFLSEHLDGSIDTWSMSGLSSQTISDIEADCYWCLSKFLDGMQDHYTFAQPGIQRLVFRLRELVHRIDESLSRHMEEQGLEFLQFAFRWFNCLLIREIPFHLVTRLWDTYLAEGDSLPDFLVYITTSFLLTWSDKLLKLDFQEMVMFLQHIPTMTWNHHELEMVLSRAYMWHSMFSQSPRHLAS